MIAGSSGKTQLGPSPAMFAVLLALLLLSGCQSEGYPEKLIYPLRADPLVIRTPDQDAPGFDRPGEYPEALFVGLSTEERAKLLVSPSKMEEGQRHDLDQALTRIERHGCSPRRTASRCRSACAPPA